MSPWNFELRRVMEVKGPGVIIITRPDLPIAQ
jgi:hypothetical protein